MGRPLESNGTTLTPYFPTSEIIQPAFRYPDESGIIVNDEALTVNSTGRVRLTYLPVWPASVRIFTAAEEGGSQLTTITEGTPGAGEVLVEPNGNLTFHSVEYSSTAYAWYTGNGSAWGKSDSEILYGELQQRCRNGGIVFGRCNTPAGQTKGDLVTVVGKATNYWIFEKTSDPALVCAMCYAAATEGQATPYLVYGPFLGLAEAFGAQKALLCGSNGRPTTIALGSVPTIKRWIGISYTNGAGWINFGNFLGEAT